MKLTTIFFILLLSVSSILLIFSCQKKAPNVITINKGTYEHSSVDKSAIQDVVDIHNGVLEQFDSIRHFDITTMSLWVDSMVSVAGYSSDSAIRIHKLFVDQNNNVYNDESQMFADLKSKYSYYNQDSAFFSAKIDRFFEFIDGINTSNTTMDASNWMTAYEAKIDTTPMSDSEATSIYMCIYLGKASLSFWKSHLHPNDVLDLNGNPEAIRCWVCVVIADVVGGALCSGGGPPGAIAGAICGSLIGRLCWCRACRGFANVNCQL